MSVKHIIFTNGDQEWYMDGKKHREGGPAIIYANGGQEWWLNGKLHREDGPASTSAYCNYWFRDHKLHRVDGPAIVRANGDQEWWINYNRHREDGPAVISTIKVEYYNHGVFIKEEPYNSEIHEKYKYKPGSKTKAALRDNSIN